MTATSLAAPPAETKGSTAARIPELDGARGLAIALVLVYHYSTSFIPSSGLLHYALLPTRLMWSGVDLFFVLSGLLIGGILLDHKESRSYYSVFYWRRVHRIFPLYYVMIALLVLGVWVFPHSPLFVGSLPLWSYPLYAQNLLGNMTRAPGWMGVTWSLAIEEQFYLLFPLIVRLLSRKALLRFLGFCILGAPVLRTILVQQGWGILQIHPLLPCRADALAFGVLAAIMMRNEDAKSWIRKNSRYLYGCLLALFGLQLTTLKWTTSRYTGTVGYSIFELTYFLLVVLLLVAPFPRLQAAFRARWLCWLGTVSYCVYLVHVPVSAGLSWLFQLGAESSSTGPKALLATTASLAVTLAVAQLSWVMLEKRLIKRAHVKYQY